MTENDDYGHMVSIDEVMLSESPFKEEKAENQISTVGNELWSYHNEGRIHGIPVAENAVGLPIDRDDMLDVAFTLKRVPKSKIFWMSPEDGESIKLYDAMLAQQADGQLIIIDELKQYDTSKCKFMVWLRYDELSYELNPRFDYLREELNNG